MNLYFEKFHNRLSALSTEYIRDIIHTIPWNSRLLGITGARGTGKSTLLLQYIKLNLPLNGTVLYVSLDDLAFANINLSEFAAAFVQNGGQHLFLDEVHKYPEWVIHLKNIYDSQPGLKITFTGSSLLNILDSRADLSRRALIFKMQGLSFREYLGIKGIYKTEKASLSDILFNFSDITTEVNSKTRPIQHFNKYLTHGYYPFFLEDDFWYHQRVQNVVNMILEVELPMLRRVDINSTFRLKQLLGIIAVSAPFIPNVSALSQKTGINRNTLLTYLHYLEDAALTKNLNRDLFGVSLLQKPEKIFLDNTNLAAALAPESMNRGNARETFFANQLGYQHKLTFPKTGDFIVDEKYLFEIGGKNKSKKQITSQSDAFMVNDDIEFGFGKTLPLWLFGFLY